MIGIVADDITGSGDIGVMYAKHGLAAHIYSFSDKEMPLPMLERADVAILDTNSRFDTAEAAYAKVREATLRLKREGATQFINKTCSVFRGNIGAEFDAMLDALGLSFAVVVLGFPKNGRTTVDGIHYVHGVKLEESEFRHDPVHPMARSDLAGILQSQTKRRVTTIGRGIVDAGPDELRRAIEAERRQGGYAILDVTSQHSLRIIAAAVHDEPVLCGSSALAEELAEPPPPREPPAAAAASAPADASRASESARVYGAAASPGAGSMTQVAAQAPAGVGMLVAAGSLMPQTAAQIRRLAAGGVPAYELDTHAWVTQPALRPLLLGELAQKLTEHMRAGHDALFHTTFDPVEVERTKQAGAALGLTGEGVSRLVSGAVADVAAAVLAATGQRRAVIAGGDTSAAVCARLGITGLRVHREIAAGLPSCWTLTDPALLLVLKSGSFGGETFFTDALDHLRQQ